MRRSFTRIKSNEEIRFGIKKGLFCINTILFQPLLPFLDDNMNMSDNIIKDTRYHQNWLVSFLIEKRYRLYRHTLIWAYIILTEFHQPNGPHVKLRIVLFFSAVYVNMYLLIPALLLKDRYFTYLFTLVTIIFVTYFLPAWIFDYYPEVYQKEAEKSQSVFWDIIGNMNLLGIAVFSSTAIKLLQRSKIDSTRINDLEKNTLQIELRELKNQISPHFLFNMLNNVNVLIQKDTQKASTVVMKLSEFLRYQLYEISGSSVSLQSEIKFLRDFMELEKIRRDDFHFTVTNNNPAETARMLLPPGLFLTFVENAVKHSADSNAPSSVDLSFSICEEKLIFICTNTKPQQPSFTKSGGLGLANITRRLDLLYGKTYVLNIENQHESYKVDLGIPI